MEYLLVRTSQVLAAATKTLFVAVPVDIDATQRGIPATREAGAALVSRMDGRQTISVQAPAKWQGLYFPAHQHAAGLAGKIRMCGQGDFVHNRKSALLVK